MELEQVTIVSHTKRFWSRHHDHNENLRGDKLFAEFAILVFINSEHYMDNQLEISGAYESKFYLFIILFVHF